MAHAPSCSGRVYGCFECGRSDLTINETFDHPCRCCPDCAAPVERVRERVDGYMVIVAYVCPVHGDVTAPVALVTEAAMAAIS